jgi:ethanolamine utilization cobalamin adenosyltransferase
MDMVQALSIVDDVRVNLQVARARSVDFIDALEFIEESRSIVRDDVLEAFNLIVREGKKMFAVVEPVGA